MNNRLGGTLSAVLVASVVVGGLGMSSLSVDAKAATKKVSVVNSSKKIESDKKMVSGYVVKTAKELGKSKSALRELGSYSLDSYDEMETLYGIHSFKLMESSSFKKESLRLQAMGKKNDAALKGLVKVRGSLSEELAKVKSVSDVMKHRKEVSSYKKSYKALDKSIHTTYDRANEAVEDFSVYMERQGTLSKIIYGDDIDVFYNTYRKSIYDYDQEVTFDVYKGKRVGVRLLAFNVLQEGLEYKLERLNEADNNVFYQVYLKKMASGNLLAAHNEYVNFSEGAYKKSLAKWKKDVKKSYDGVYKLK